MSLLAAARDDLDRQFRPAGYNIGINDGAAAGQTVPHLHIHLIPRYEGDRDDPRAGFAGCFRTRPRTGTRTDRGQGQGLRDTPAVPAGPDLAPVARRPDPVHRQHRAHPVGGLVRRDVQVRPVGRARGTGDRTRRRFQSRVGAADPRHRGQIRGVVLAAGRALRGGWRLGPRARAAPEPGQAGQRHFAARRVAGELEGKPFDARGSAAHR